MNYLSVCLNPTLQKTLRFPSIALDMVNRTGLHRLDVSGKGINVTRVLHQLGKKAVHLTQLGGVMRPLFLSLCAADALSVEWAESESPIRFCYTMLNDADSSVTELVEESEPVAAGTEECLLEKFDALLPGSDCLIVSGTKAAGFSDRVIPLMVQRAKERGIVVILDIRGKDLVESLAFKPDIVKPNLYEFALTFAPDLVKGGEVEGDETARRRIEETVLDLCQKYSCRIVLTRGAGQIWAGETGNFFAVDFEPVKPLNTTGSGDAFTAGLACALGDGLNFAAAIHEGIRCGALNARCLRPGVIQ
jgi:1-phosphofructokinase/tagatose 6-phosphate kinase